MKRIPPCKIITALIADGWQSPDTYDKHFAPLPQSAGVYILLAIQLSPLEADYMKTKIAYIGMSTNLEKRLSPRHQAMACIQEGKYFAKRMFKECGKSELRKLEAELIRRFDPLLNVMGNRRLCRG